MTNQSAIAAAQQAARNPYACAHVNAAHARLIAWLIENPPPAFTVHPTPDQFDYAAKFLRDLASTADELVYQIEWEARSNARSHISNDAEIFSDALHDSSLPAELEREAYELNTEAVA